MEPAVLSGAYETLKPSLEKLAGYTQSRLGAELKELPLVAIVARVKDVTSVLEKLQTGRFESLRGLDDLAGVKVVMLTRSDVVAAVDVVRSSFQIVRENRRTTDPSDFKHRQPHLIVLPPQPFIDRNSDLAGLQTEVQVTTVLQHALDQITHGFDYKPSTLSWGKRRIVAQLRASLELIDHLLDDMEVSARVVNEESAAPERLRHEQDVLTSIAGVFTEAQLPTDRRRFAETANGLTISAGVEPAAIADLLNRHTDLRDATAITPLDALLGALLRENGPDLVGKHKKRFLVSPELESLCSQTKLINADRRVALT